MTLDELVRLIQSEANRSEDRDVDAPSAELVRDIEQRGGERVTDFLADGRKTGEPRVFRYWTSARSRPACRGNRRVAEGVAPSRASLGPGRLAPPGERKPSLADLETGRSYAGLAPLAAWALARTKMYGPDARADLLSDR